MPFHIKRSHTAHQEILYQYNGVRSTRWVTPPDGLSVLEIQTTYRPTDLQKIPDDKNYLTPPYHWHWYQDEFFHVKQGQYIFTLEGRQITVSASDPQPVRIPARARHTFKIDDTYEGPCTVEISTTVSPNSAAEDPEANGPSARFFRNVYSYFDDCYTQGVSPSVPQLLLMLDHGEMSLAFSFGPDWLMRALSYLLGVIVGRWFGGYVLGYKSSYPEYWDDSLETKKAR